MDRYAVMGYPIGHSKSPIIHTLFARQTQQTLTYEKLEVPPENFQVMLHDFINQGGCGLNITVPLKKLAWAAMDECSAYAYQAKAVNTISITTDGKLQGHNTDGIGLVRDLQNNHKLTLSNKHILILGAGGAVQGILQPLLECNPANIVIANRTLEKALALASDFSPFGKLEACTYEALKVKRFDIIINGTSTGLNNQIPPLPNKLLNDGGISYDMMYGDNPTAFVRWGHAQGAALALDGLGMLVEQAAEAFFIWRGIFPQTKPVIAQLRTYF